MKCIKSQTGNIYRVTNNRAALMVATERYSYTTKAVWKKSIKSARTQAGTER